MTFEEAMGYVAIGEPVQRDSWDEDRMVAQGADGSLAVHSVASGKEIGPYSVGADGLATDWLLVA